MKQNDTIYSVNLNFSEDQKFFEQPAFLNSGVYIVASNLICYFPLAPNFVNLIYFPKFLQRRVGGGILFLIISKIGTFSEPFCPNLINEYIENINTVYLIKVIFLHFANFNFFGLCTLLLHSFHQSSQSLTKMMKVLNK